MTDIVAPPKELFDGSEADPYCLSSYASTQRELWA